jgi:membrane protease YdiL (CAAX protease family)
MEFRLSRKTTHYSRRASFSLMGIPPEPLAAIIIGEAFLFFGNLEASIIIHLLNIMMCVLAPMLLKENPILWQSFSLVSMLRVLNLGMPKFFTMTIYWIPLVYAPVIIVGFLLIRNESLGWRDYLQRARKFFETRMRPSGWKLWYLPLGLGASLLLANFEFVVLSWSIEDLRMIPDLTIANLVLLFVVMVFFVGLGEELVFRYILQARLEGVAGTVAAIAVSSVVFATMHSGYQSMAYIGYVFLVSVFLGILYFRTKSLALVTLIHGSLNFFLFSFLPYGYLVLF